MANQGNLEEMMTKPEPLKGKEEIWCLTWYDDSNLGKETNVAIINGIPKAVEMKKVRDIESAVEWLKFRLNKEHKGNGYVIEGNLVLINDIIDEAFEDVMKSD